MNGNRLEEILQMQPQSPTLKYHTNYNTLLISWTIGEILIRQYFEHQMTTKSLNFSNLYHSRTHKARKNFINRFFLVSICVGIVWYSNCNCKLCSFRSFIMRLSFSIEVVLILPYRQSWDSSVIKVIYHASTLVLQL